MGEHTISGIGISTAGIVNIHKGIVTGGVEHIRNYATIPIIDRLQEVLQVPVSVENDVNCAALGRRGRVLEMEKKFYYAYSWNWYWRSNFYRWRVI